MVFAEHTPISSVRQLGLVTSDVARFIDNMRILYGLEPDRTAFVPPEANDETCLRKLAFYNFPEVELEVVQPVHSLPAWHEFLEKHGDCLQHVQYNVDSLSEAIERMEKNGVEMIERGHSITNPAVEYCFFDTTAQLGFVTEIVNFREIEG